MSNPNFQSPDDNENFEALRVLRSCIEHMEKRFDRLMRSHVNHRPHARLPEGEPDRIRGISAENAAELSAAGAPALDRVYLAGPDPKHAHIMLAITFDNLSPNLKELLRILSEEGAAPTADGLRPWKSTEYILEHLPKLKGEKSRKRGAVRQLIHRLREEFVRRGLDPMLIETQPGKARLRVRCGQDPLSPPSAPPTPPPPCDTPPSA